jgi:hypothetical protein
LSAKAPKDMLATGRPSPTGLAGRQLFENCEVCRSAPSERLEAETLEILTWRSIVNSLFRTPRHIGQSTKYECNHETALAYYKTLFLLQPSTTNFDNIKNLNLGQKDFRHQFEIFLVLFARLKNNCVNAVFLFFFFIHVVVVEMQKQLL